jgi:hypothetical protein
MSADRLNVIDRLEGEWEQLRRRGALDEALVSQVRDSLKI